MKELNQYIKDQLALPGEHQQIKKKKFLGSMILQNGMKMWELNIDTKEIKPATYDQSTVDMNGTIKRTLIYKEACIYAVAINKKNAERKFKQILLKSLE